MSIIVTLILISLVVALGFLGAFIWATKKGQFDDGFTPSVRILFDDAPKIETEPGPISTDSTISTNSTITTNE